MKRLNVKLLVGLLISVVVLSGAAYGIWRFQMRRNSQNFIVWADEAREKDNIEKEAEFLWRYLLDNKQNQEIKARYAKVATELAEKDPRRILPAINACTDVLREDEKNTEIRRRLGDMYLKLGRLSDAGAQLERVREENPKDGEVAKLLARCYVAQENVAGAEELLKQAIEANPQDVELYQLLGMGIYQQTNKDEAKAKEVIDQMVAANPDSWEAHLRRFQFQARTGEITDQARADLAKALELGPEEPQVLILAAERAAMEKNFDQARELLARGRQAKPEMKEIYVAQSQLERMAGDDAAAQARLEEALKVLPSDHDLLWLLADLHLRASRPEQVRELIAKMEEYNVPTQRVDYVRALVLLQEHKADKALEILNRIRPLFAQSQGFQQQIDANRAICYRMLGQIDQEIQIYRNMLLIDPINGPKLELARALSQTGRGDEAVGELQEMAERGNPAAQAMMFQNLLARNLRLPPEQRNWQATDVLVDVLAPADTDDPRRLVMRADYLLKKGEAESAKKLLDDNRAKLENEVVFWIAQAELANKTGQDEALKVVDEAEQKLGPKPELRLARISLLAQKGDVASKQALEQILESAKQLPAAEQDQTLRALGQVFYGLRDFEKAESIFKQLAASPANANDIQMQIVVFTIQRDAGDDAGMEETLAKIKEVAPGGELNQYYQFCQAAKIVSAVQRGKADVSELTKARAAIDAASKDRPNWGQAWGLRGEIEERSGNVDAAIAAFQRSIELGDVNPLRARHLAALLLSQNKADQVQALMDRIPNGKELLGSRIQALVDLAQGDVADAVPAAIESVQNDPNKSHVTQIWLGDVLTKGGRFEEAEAAYRTAIEVAPDVPDGYVALATFLSKQERTDEVAAIVTDMQAKLKPEQLELALAAVNEASGNYSDSEANLKKALEKNPDDLRVLEGLAALYARSNQTEKMLEVIRQLADIGEKATPEQRGYVQRANRNLAVIEAKRGTPDAIKNAIEMVQRNGNPELSSDDKVFVARLKASLGDPASRREALGILNDVLAKEPERPNERLLMAQILDQEGNWREAKDAMLGLVSSEKYKNQPALLASYADMLLKHGEVNEAEGYIKRLEDLKLDKDPIFLTIKARQLRDQGKTDEAIALLTNQIVRPLSPEGVSKLREIADQLVALSRDNADSEKYLAAAEKSYQEYVQERPESILVLVSFLGQYRSLEKAFEVAQQAHADGVPALQIAQLGLSLLRGQSDQVNDKLVGMEEGWLKEELDKDPQSATANLLMADFYDLRGNYDGAAEIYAKLKDRTDLTMEGRVTVLNNLAFIWAVRDNKGEDAYPLIEEAVKAIGPLAELLDTRAMVQLSRGKVKEAISDLETSLESGPNPVKYFHLARARLAAGDREGAAAAFDQARNAGLTPTTVPALEKTEYERLNKEFPPKASAATN